MKLLLLSTVLTAIGFAQSAPPCPPLCGSGGNRQTVKKAVKAQKPQPAAAKVKATK